MDENYLTQIMDSIQQKVGVEASAVIADDLGNLITKNSEALKTIKGQQDKIKDLQNRNEKLVIANGNLLQQVDMQEDNNLPKAPQDEPKPISMKACFDSQGNFIQ